MACGGIAWGRDLLGGPPPVIPSDRQALAAPEIGNLALQGQSQLNYGLPLRGQGLRQSIKDLLASLCDSAIVITAANDTGQAGVQVVPVHVVGQFTKFHVALVPALGEWGTTHGLRELIYISQRYESASDSSLNVSPAPVNR